jgi:ribosomal protein S25
LLVRLPASKAKVKAKGEKPRAKIDGATGAPEASEAKALEEEAAEAAVNEAARMDGVTVEKCGSWYWLGGNTKANRERLKALKFRWCSAKQRWYMRPAGQAWFRSKGKAPLSMPEIREKWGTEDVKAA